MNSVWLVTDSMNTQQIVIAYDEREARGLTGNSNDPSTVVEKISLDHAKTVLTCYDESEWE